MPIKLYILNGSPPCRTTLITANAVGLSLDVHVLKSHEDLYTPTILKINPQHTVPFLDDDGKVISDSHAISAYLVGKYGKDDFLYPKDFYQRSLVDEKMFYDASVMFPTVTGIIIGYLRREFKTIPTDKIQPVEEVFKTLEKFLEKRKWITGDNVTIADFCCGTTSLSLDNFCPIDNNVYPKLGEWLNRVKKLSYFKIDEEQFQHHKNFIHGISNWN